MILEEFTRKRRFAFKHLLGPERQIARVARGGRIRLVGLDQPRLLGGTDHLGGRGRLGLRQPEPLPQALVPRSSWRGLQGGLGFGQAQLAGDQAGEQGVAEGGEGLGLQLIGNDLFHQWINGGIEAIR